MSCRRLLASLILGFITAGLAACAQAPPAPTATLLPTPTPAPTPTPTPSLAEGLDPAAMPLPDPRWSAALFQLLSPVPENRGPVIFIDVEALKGNPKLQAGLRLEVLGLLDTLPAESIRLLESLVVAIPGSNQGMVAVLHGPIDVEGLLQLAGGFGATTAGSDQQNHRGHPVRSIEIVGVTLAVGSADGSTALLASGSPAGDTPALQQVQAALDAYDGLVPRLRDDPEIARLIDNLPPGVAAALFADCAGLGSLTPVDSLTGCAAVGFSAEAVDQDLVAFNILAAFQDELQASAALAALNQGEIQLGGLASKKAAARQEGYLLRLRLIVELSEVAVGFDALAAPAR